MVSSHLLFSLLELFKLSLDLILDDLSMRLDDVTTDAPDVGEDEAMRHVELDGRLVGEPLTGLR